MGAEGITRKDHFTVANFPGFWLNGAKRSGTRAGDIVEICVLRVTNTEPMAGALASLKGGCPRLSDIHSEAVPAGRRLQERSCEKAPRQFV
jgi:hypothetical protein